MKLSIKAYLLSYKKFKFALDEARQKQNMIAI